LLSFVNTNSTPHIINTIKVSIIASKLANPFKKENILWHFFRKPWIIYHKWKV